MTTDQRDKLAEVIAALPVEATCEEIADACLASMSQSVPGEFPEAEFVAWYSTLHEVDKSPAEIDCARWAWARAKDEKSE